MIVYIDDIRNPAYFLPGVEVVWLKEWWEARNFLVDHQAEITEIHFDNQMGDIDNHTGIELFHMVAFERMWNANSEDSEWVNVTKIYLHSSDTDVVENAIDLYGEKLRAVGIELINNSID